MQAEMSSHFARSVENPLNEQIPPWQETGQRLASEPVKLLTAEIIYNAKLLESIYEDAQAVLPWLRAKIHPNGRVIDKEQDDAMIMGHIRGLVDFYLEQQQGDNNYTTGRSTDERAFYTNRLSAITRTLEGNKDRIYYEVEQLSLETMGKNQTEGIKKARFTASRHSSGQTYLSELVPTLPDETFRESLIRKKDTIKDDALTIALQLSALYGTNTAAGIGGKFLENSGVENHFDIGKLWMGVGLSYAFWIGAMTVQSGQNYRWLEEEGISTSVLSKKMYDAAKHITDKKLVHNIASRLGYAIPELAPEAIWWGTAGLIFLATDSGQRALAFIIGANMVATGYELGLAGVTKGRLFIKKEIIPEIKELQGRGYSKSQLLEHFINKFKNLSFAQAIGEIIEEYTDDTRSENVIFSKHSSSYPTTTS